MIQTTCNRIKAYKVQIEKNSGITLKDDSPLLTWLPRHAAWQHTRFHKQQGSTTAYEKIRHMSYQSPILLVGKTVAGRRPKTLINRLESAWFEGIWLGRDSKTDEHLIATPTDMIRSRALKRRVERQRWDINLPNAMIWDPWNPTPVTKGKPSKVHSDREPIPTRPIPRIHVTSPAVPDEATTAAVPTQETTPGTTTAHSAAERTRVRLPERTRVRLPEKTRVRLTERTRVRLPDRTRVRLPERARVRLLEAKAEGALPVQKTRTTSLASSDYSCNDFLDYTTTSSARALI